MTKEITLEEIQQLDEHMVKKTVRNAKFNALDTETINGKARVLATPSKYWVAHSFESCVEPMISESKNKGSKFFCYNLDYDMRAIIKHLPESVARELIGEGVPEIEYNGYLLKYIPAKLFIIKRLSTETDQKDRQVTLYDIAQFYNYLPLDVAGKQFLDSKKISNAITNNIKTKQGIWPIETMEQYYIKNFHEIGKYCQKDSLLTAGLANLMFEKIKQVFGVTVNTWTSKASISEKLSYKKGKYPNHQSNSTSYALAQTSFGGGMFDLWQKGYFTNGVTEIDISSAYPDVQVNIPHWGNGEFISIKSNKDLLKNDYYGWLIAVFDCPYIPHDINDFEKATLHVNKEEIDIIYKIKKIYYADGSRTKVITLHEYKFMKKYGYECTLIEGIVWRPTTKKYKEVFSWINDVYKLKSKYKKKFGKGSIEYSLVKIALNGTYGKTVQSVGASVMQDFRTGSYITAVTRIKIISFIIEHGLLDKVILIATDGIYLDGIHKFDDLGSGLGSWDCDYYSSMFVVGNGVYECFNEKGQPVKTKLRGYGSGKYMFKNVSIEFSLKHECQKHQNETAFIASHKGVHKTKPLKLPMCLNYKSFSYEDMNVFMHNDKQFSVNNNSTKKWPEDLTFEKLLNNTFRGERFTTEELGIIEKEAEIELIRMGLD